MPNIKLRFCWSSSPTHHKKSADTNRRTKNNRITICTFPGRCSGQNVCVFVSALCVHALYTQVIRQSILISGNSGTRHARRTFDFTRNYTCRRHRRRRRNHHHHHRSDTVVDFACGAPAPDKCLRKSARGAYVVVETRRRAMLAHCAHNERHKLRERARSYAAPEPYAPCQRANAFPTRQRFSSGSRVPDILKVSCRSCDFGCDCRALRPKIYTRRVAKSRVASVPRPAIISLHTTRYVLKSIIVISY